MNEKYSLWDVFELCCATPHQSGSEQNLVEVFKLLASKNDNLKITQDKIGNLRIDRKASMNFENAPKIIMQGHLDMVPQKVSNVNFDFDKDPIKTIVKDGWMYSNSGTTLGADNGIGISAAMALLLDNDFKCGAIAGLFTIDEERGLSGAVNIEEKMLDGDILLNLDSEDEKAICIGCAGGERTDIDTPIVWEKVDTKNNFIGVKLSVTPLKGGHSGIDINKNRNNAIVITVQTLSQLKDFGISSITGGTLSNAIPREAFACGTIPNEKLGEYQSKCDAFAKEIRQKYDCSDNFSIKITPEKMPEKIWNSQFKEKLFSSILSVENGAIEIENNFVISSSNLATISTDKDSIVLQFFYRSANNYQLDAISDKIIKLFTPLCSKFEVTSRYSGWLLDKNANILNTISSAYENVYKTKPKLEIIHAGLECGALSEKKSNLEMVSIGMDIENPHSPSERVRVASVDKFELFLRKIISMQTEK